MSAGAHWAIAIHGGAGTIPRSSPTLLYEQALHRSLEAGYEVLVGGVPYLPWSEVDVAPPPLALGAALAAVESLEECPLFNAGYGAVLNNRAFCETEAAVMDGKSMRTGAACGLRTVKLPSRLATLIYCAADFQHLGFSAAERYADRYPALIERADPGWFLTDRRKASLRRAQEEGRAKLDHSGDVGVQKGEERVGEEREGETVGATVCDGHGNVAVVTSTGGVTNKWEGRIGDTPMIGAGSYASNKSCGVSGTGWGEQFIRFSAGSRVCFAVEYGGMSVKDAVYEVVHRVFPEDTGGFVGVTPEGEVVMDKNSVGMYRGCRSWRGADFVKIWE